MHMLIWKQKAAREGIKKTGLKSQQEQIDIFFLILIWK